MGKGWEVAPLRVIVPVKVSVTSVGVVGVVGVTGSSPQPAANNGSINVQARVTRRITVL